MRKNEYAMVDYNERIELCDSIWVISINCGEDEFQKLCALSHKVNGMEYKGELLDECESEALMQILEIEGYDVDSYEIPIINW